MSYVEWAEVAILPSGVEGLSEAAARGFRDVELEAREERPAEHLEALADSGLFVRAVRLSGALHAGSARARRAELARLKRQVEDGARLGAHMAYLPTPAAPDAKAWAYFVDGSHQLADYAAGRMCLGVSAPPGAAEWPEGLDHDFMVFVVEGDDVELARQVGEQLSYVRRPGKLMVVTLQDMEYAELVAVELQSPHTSSSTSSAT